MKIRVNAATHQYDVTLGKGILKDTLKAYDGLLQKADKIIVLTDENVWAKHQAYFEASIDYNVHVLVLPPGEDCKTMDVFEEAHTFMLTNQCTRKSFVIALGGGAVGDLAGFVAATFMRGVPFIQVPTTILAHDSAVGGKTAINHKLGKNMIGAFYQPEAVIYDTTFLETLPEVEVRSGMAEVVKHAMLSDKAWYQELLNLIDYAIAPELLTTYLAKGIQVKASIVEQDETEQSVRKYLNLGHTYGHAVEAAAGYGKLTHGECVMIGLVFMLLLSEEQGDITADETNAFISFAAQTGYPLRAVFDYSFDTLLPYMMKDKKADYGELQFVLLKQIGEPYVQKIDGATVKRIDEQLRARLTEVLR